MTSRYINTPITKTSDGIRLYKTTLYPQINPQIDDIYVITDRGDRLDNLSYEYYKDSTLYWIISISNNIPQDSIFIPVGTQIRIPQNIENILKDFESLNQNR
jgi:hypothetical protein